MAASEQDRVLKAFEEALNRHGYSFQYRVLEEVKQRLQAGSSLWGIEVPEFPVEVQGYGTRIDFILKHTQRPIYLVAECKRANPALSAWCFAKQPSYLSPSPSNAVNSIAVVRYENGQIAAGPQFLALTPNIFHLALEVKTNEKGDSTGQRGVIEEATAQVCRGVNGLVNFFYNQPDLLTIGQTVRFVPAIFTTAKLWTANVDLSSADLASGNIDLKGAHIEETKWLFYDYHQSPGLQHSIGRPAFDISEAL